VTDLKGNVRLKMVVDKTIIKSYFTDPIFNKEKYTHIDSVSNGLTFFKNNNLSLNLANKGENRLSLNSDLIHYKLYAGNPNDINDYRIRKYNIPLLLISKISSMSDTITKSSAYDILDYNGSP